MNIAPRAVDICYRLMPGRVVQDTVSGPAGQDNVTKISDHIVIAGYGITGKSVARAAEITGIPYTVIELNPDIIQKEKTARRPFFIFGDAVQEEVLDLAGICHARALVVVVYEQEAVPRIVHRAHKMSPSVYIIARTVHIRHAQYLLDLGADEVVSEEYEAAKEIFTRALRKYHLMESEIGKIVQRLQDWGYAKLVRNGESSSTISAMDAVLESLHIQTLIVEPGSFAEGKSIADLDLNGRYGITDGGLRRNKATDITPDLTTRLKNR